MDIRLSVEELAVILSYVGTPEAGQELVRAQLGEMNKDELRARLLSAGHSLMARGEMAIEADGKFIFPDPLLKIAKLMMQPDYSIQFGKADGRVELILTYHFGQKRIVEHTLEQGVVHVFKDVPIKSVIDGGWNLIQGAKAKGFKSALAKIDSKTLEKLKSIGDKKEIESQLLAHHIDATTARLLAEDISVSKSRASVLRVNYVKDGAPTSERGFLTLQGSKRFWLMLPEATSSGTLMTIVPASRTLFENEVSKLLDQ